jgi:hypothetical protein
MSSFTVKIKIIVKKCNQLMFPTLQLSKIYMDKNHLKLAKRISPDFYLRRLILAKFIETIPPHLNKNKVLNVAIVGGYLNEVEVIALQSLGYQVKVFLYGISHESQIFDLNEMPIPKNEIGFDLILCSNVFEHIWNHDFAIRKIRSLMNQETIIYISVPTSDFAHGYPDYFSSGLTDSFISNLLIANGFRIMSLIRLGTPRAYLSLHLLKIWLPVKGHSLPLLFAYSNLKFPLNILLTLKNFFKLLILSFASPRITDDINHACRSFVVGKLK